MKSENIVNGSDSVGSPSTRREWIEMSDVASKNPKPFASPSTRREWIEIEKANGAKYRYKVSLHTEGVD